MQIEHNGILFGFDKEKGYANIPHFGRLPRPQFYVGCKGHLKSENGILFWTDQKNRKWSWDGGPEITRCP